MCDCRRNTITRLDRGPITRRLGCRRVVDGPRVDIRLRDRIIRFNRFKVSRSKRCDGFNGVHSIDQRIIYLDVGQGDVACVFDFDAVGDDVPRRRRHRKPCGIRGLSDLQCHIAGDGDDRCSASRPRRGNGFASRIGSRGRDI